MGVGEERPRSHREVVPTGSTTIERRLHRPDLGLRTTRAVRAFRPAEGFQISAAGGVLVKALVEFQNGLRVIGHANYYNRLGLGESSA